MNSVMDDWFPLWEGSELAEQISSCQFPPTKTGKSL